MADDLEKTAGAGTFRPVNVPETVAVQEDPNGLPAALMTKRRQPVAAVEDRWRIDDEWWRLKPISRAYYAVLLSSGHRLVLYKDLVTGDWYKQAL